MEDREGAHKTIEDFLPQKIELIKSTSLVDSLASVKGEQNDAGKLIMCFTGFFCI